MKLAQLSCPAFSFLKVRFFSSGQGPVPVWTVSTCDPSVTGFSPSTRSVAFNGFDLTCG